MIITMYILEMLRKGIAFLAKYKWYVLIGLVVFVIIVSARCGDDKKEEIRIVVPNQQIEEMYKRRNEELERRLAEIDAKREETDQKLRQLKEKVRRGNVSAKELEDLLK